MGGSTFLLFLAPGGPPPPAISGPAGPIQTAGPFGFGFFTAGPPVPALTLTEALAVALLADPALAAVVGSRSYYEKIPRAKSPALPAVVFRVASIDYGANLDGLDGTAEASVEFVALASDPTVPPRLVARLRRLFDLTRTTLSGLTILAANPTDDSPDLDAPDDGSDSAAYRDGCTVRFLHENP